MATQMAKDFVKKTTKYYMKFVKIAMSLICRCFSYSEKASVIRLQWVCI